MIRLKQIASQSFYAFKKIKGRNFIRVLIKASSIYLISGLTNCLDFKAKIELIIACNVVY